MLQNLRHSFKIQNTGHRENDVFDFMKRTVNRVYYSVVFFYFSSVENRKTSMDYLEGQRKVAETVTISNKIPQNLIDYTFRSMPHDWRFPLR